MIQKKLIHSALLISLAILPPSAFSSPLPILSASGEPKVTFKAVGRPSALKIEGKSSQLVSKLDLEKGLLKGSMEFELKTLDTGLALRDRHMKEKYLEVEKHPLTRLELSPTALPPALLAPTGGTESLKTQGELTLHGVTRPGEVQAVLARKEGPLRVQSSFALKLTDFGIDIPKFAGITVAEDVTIEVEFAVAAP